MYLLSKEAIIKGYGKNKTDRNITIPSEVSASSEYTNAADYQNIPVTAIDQGAFALTECPRSVNIPASIESIGTNAFAGGEKQKVYILQSVTIEEGSKLNWIGEAAFQSQASPACLKQPSARARAYGASRGRIPPRPR